MNIIGTIYLVDEPHIDILKNSLMANPPPKGRIATGTILCMDMDDGDNMLELYFPDHAQKATLLCPPPLAMYKEIDGDLEGFIQEYNEYLDHEESVQDFIASMLLFLHLGGNIMLYTPSNLEDEPVWLNTLIMFFYTRFGITVGGPTTQAAYDPSYDAKVADIMYIRGGMDVFDYIASSSGIAPSVFVQDRLIADLAPYCGYESNPIEYYMMAKQYQAMGLPACRPAIAFG